MSEEKTKKEKLTLTKKQLGKIKEHVFCGNKYKFRWEKPPKIKDEEGRLVQPTGLCDSPDSFDKEIIIDPSIDDLELLKTAIDEAIHACDFSIDNDYVDMMSESIGSFLWRMGYRREKS